MDYILKLSQYKNYLISEEKSKNTIEKYLRDIRLFLNVINENDIDKNVVLEFKTYLIERYAPKSVNSMLAGVNKFLEFLGLERCKVKPLKIQKDIFVKTEKELTQKEYTRLIETAEKKGKFKLSLLIQTICATGIRVSELKFIKAECLKSGRVEVNLKGKNRIIFIPKDLRSMLKNYCKKEKITTGVIFKTKNGNSLNRSNIWKMMKSICKLAKVNAEKVFPHNLRHLFARTYYKIHKDISRLADILGHSNINTTRIYTMESGTYHEKQMEKMNLAFCRITT